MQYDFHIGQIVRLKRRYPGRPSATDYLVLRLVAAGEDDVPLYCVRSLSSGVEWIARQDRLEPSDLR